MPKKARSLQRNVREHDRSHNPRGKSNRFYSEQDMVDIIGRLGLKDTSATRRKIIQSGIVFTTASRKSRKN